MSAISLPYNFPIVCKPITANYSMGPESVIFADPTGGNITVTLPPMATSINKIYYIKKTSLSGNLVIINGDGGETIDGNASVTITAANASVALLTDGVDWKII